MVRLLCYVSAMLVLVIAATSMAAAPSAPGPEDEQIPGFLTTDDVYVLVGEQSKTLLARTVDATFVSIDWADVEATGALHRDLGATGDGGCEHHVHMRATILPGESVAAPGILKQLQVTETTVPCVYEFNARSFSGDDLAEYRKSLAGAVPDRQCQAGGCDVGEEISLHREA